MADEYIKALSEILKCFKTFVISLLYEGKIDVSELNKIYLNYINLKSEKKLSGKEDLWEKLQYLWKVQFLSYKIIIIRRSFYIFRECYHPNKLDTIF